MAALDLIGACVHPLGEEAFQVGMDGAILGGYDGPARLGLPCGPANLLLLLRTVAGEILNAFREYPDPSVGNFDVVEDGRRVLVKLARHGFISGGSNRGDVDQPDNANRFRQR